MPDYKKKYLFLKDKLNRIRHIRAINKRLVKENKELKLANKLLIETQKDVSLKLPIPKIEYVLKSKESEITTFNVQRKMICEKFKISETAFDSKSRNRVLIYARLAVLSSLKDFDVYVLSELFNRDRTTIIASLKTLKNLIDSKDKTFLEFIH